MLYTHVDNKLGAKETNSRFLRAPPKTKTVSAYGSESVSRTLGCINVSTRDDKLLRTSIHFLHSTNDVKLPMPLIKKIT